MFTVAAEPNEIIDFKSIGLSNKAVLTFDMIISKPLFMT